MWRASLVRLFLSFPVFAPICRVTDAKHKTTQSMRMQTRDSGLIDGPRHLEPASFETCPGIYTKEALLENVAAERVSLSKIASGPCVPHRSFHRA